MTKLMDKAIDALKRLPEDAQDAMAAEVLARIEEEAEWDQRVATDQSQRWLLRAARQALKDRAEGRVRDGDPSDDGV